MSIKSKIDEIVSLETKAERIAKFIFALPKGSRIRYIGADRTRGDFPIPGKKVALETNTYGYKVRNCKAESEKGQVEVIFNSKSWKIPVYCLTTDTLDVTEKLLS